ncbi:hypothetical protein B0H63DRAFT_268 [Podospora didyma]|uniref:Uncharacterized protein n=1 Tax=Podospora didyma TaxID=330526 RepID=A0AAE0P3M7_9PEZI|nr:hypothetical protein B0H63DRAFT_268 [Podospora didyma]
MARRLVVKGLPRASRGLVSRPTPIPSSTTTTPASSALPSAYASEAEGNPDDDVSQIPIGALTLADDSAELPVVKKPKLKKKQPFRFMELPSELRIKVYAYHFDGGGSVIDLDSDNYKLYHKKLAILRTCRTIYNEATHIFYSIHAVRIFPTTPGRHFKTKKPLLARLNTRQRRCLTSLELRLGPGWSQPPRGWVVNPALGLADCTSVRRLTVYAEVDPSDAMYNGWRRSDGFYEGFCQDLLDGVLAEMPFLDRVYFDGFPGVKQSGPMVRGLIQVALAKQKKICWGPERGWTDFPDDGSDDPSNAATKRSGKTIQLGTNAAVTVMA